MLKSKGPLGGSNPFNKKGRGMSDKEGMGSDIGIFVLQKGTGHFFKVVEGVKAPFDNLSGVTTARRAISGTIDGAPRTQRLFC